MGYPANVFTYGTSMIHDQLDNDPLKEFEPDAAPLISLVIQRVDESMLREIAEADYGVNQIYTDLW